MTPGTETEGRLAGSDWRNCDWEASGELSEEMAVCAGQSLRSGGLSGQTENCRYMKMVVFRK